MWPEVRYTVTVPRRGVRRVARAAFARDLGGGTLVVDQRDGPMRGSIAEYDAESGVLDCGRLGLDSLVAATAAALESPPEPVSGLALYPERAADGGIGVFGGIDPAGD